MTLVAFCVIASTLVVGGDTYFELRKLVMEHATSELGAKTRLIAQRFSQAYATVARDLETIVETPPIQGIIRARKNGGIDPVDGSSEELWRQRLTTIFKSLLKGHPSYFQLRYIGLADHGLELVRVERAGEELITKHQDELQRKGGEAYFKMMQTAAVGEVVFSEVTFNREFGVLDPRRIPALRGLLPVHDARGEQFGFLVINIDYEALLRDVLHDVAPQEQAIILNVSGDYLEYKPDVGAEKNELILHQGYDRPLPKVVQKLVNHPSSDGFFESGENLIYFVKTAVEGSHSDLGFAINVERASLFSDLDGVQKNIIIFCGFILSICLLISIYIIKFVFSPLINLANLARSAGREEFLNELPTERRDEVGDLARALRNRTLELFDSEVSSAAIVNNVIDGLILIDQKGTIETFNPSCIRMFGYEADEVIGQNISILMEGEVARHHDQYLLQYVKGNSSGAIDKLRELKAVTKWGEVFPIELATSAVTLNGELKFSGIVRDIRERKEIERLRAEFVATVSHELRTPLTSIRGSLVLASQLMPESVPVQLNKMVMLAQKNTERLIYLVNSILDFEKLEAEKFTFNASRVDMGAELLRAHELNQSYMEERDVSINISVPETTLSVYLDPDRFQQIMSNLISNAVKYSEPGETVSIEAVQIASYCKVSVVDTGMGIPQSFQRKVFSPFSQADSTATRKKGGTGLGLNITKQLVEGMGGQIGFESEEGAGTTFWIQFPIARETRVKDLGYDGDPADDRLIGLHLEDDCDYAEVLAASLVDHVRMVHVWDLAEAKKHLATTSFDLVVIDIAISEQNGLELIKSIPAPEDTIVIVVSALDEVVDHPHVDAAFVKSKIQQDVFHDTVQRLLTEKRRQKKTAMVSDGL